MAVLSDGWMFRTDPDNTGLSSHWEQTMPTEARPVLVPSLWTVSAAPGYSGAAWYWYEVTPKAIWKDQTLRLRFEAVAEYAQVWLNGQRLGEHRGGATPFEFDCTKLVKPGGKSLLAVRVEGSAERGAGMWQGVLMMATDEAYIQDAFAYGGPLGNLAVDVQFYNSSDKSGDADIDVRVAAVSAPNKDIKRTGQTLSLTPKRNTTSIVVNLPRRRLMAWSPDSPSLYFVQLSFHQDKDVLDTTEKTVGLRELGWNDRKITVNAIPIEPKATAPDPGLPIVIASVGDRDAARSLFQKIKRSGFNIVYLDAPPPALLGVADEEGLLVVEGARRSLTGDRAETELADLMVRDRSHASVLCWNLRDMSDEAKDRLRKLDKTRFYLSGTANDARLYTPRMEESVAPPMGMLAESGGLLKRQR